MMTTPSPETPSEDDVVREIAQAFVSVVGANAAPWQHWEETVRAVVRASGRAGYELRRKEGHRHG